MLTSTGCLKTGPRRNNSYKCKLYLFRTHVDVLVLLPACVIAVGQIPLDGQGLNQTRPDQTSWVSDKVSDMFGSG